MSSINNEPSPSGSPKQILPTDSYIKTAREVDHLIKNSFVPPPTYGNRILTANEGTFTSPVECLLSCKEVELAIAQDIEDIAGNLDFNSLHFVRDYLNHFEAETKKNKEITPEEAFISYKPNTKNQALIEYGATCVGRSMDIVLYLKHMKSLTGYVVIESEGPDAHPTHAAVIIPCKDGIVLIDAVYDQKICIILFEQGPSEEVSMRMDIKDRAYFSFEQVQIPGHLTAKEPILLKKEVQKNKTVYKQILLRTISHPDEPIRKKAFLDAAGSFPVCDSLKPDCLMYVMVKEKKIKIKMGRGEQALRAELPFTAFDPINRTIDTSSLSKEQADIFLTDKFFQTMHTKKETMLDELFLIISHYETLKSLYKSMGKPF